MAEMIWVEWIPYDDSMRDRSVRTKVPDSPGVYQIRIKGVDCGTIPGAQPLVYVGVAKSSIRKQAIEVRLVNSNRNFTPIEKRLRASGFAMEFRYCLAPTGTVADQWAVQVMQEYESIYSSLPLANRIRKR